MNKLIIIILLLIYEIYSCSQCVQMSFYNCNICYQNCEEGLIFNSCSQTYCTGRNSNDDCLRYETRSLSQSQCFSSCCNDDVNSPIFNLEDLQKCKEGNDQNMALLIGILVGIFGSIFLVCILCICCSKERCENICQILIAIITCCFCCRHLRQTHNNNNDQVYKDPKQTSIERLEVLAWNYDVEQKGQKTLQKYTVCTICLCDRVNAITECDHCFHDQCILDWFKKSKSCPNCLRTQINIIKIYCRSCMQRYVEVNLNNYSNMEEVHKQIKGPNCQICQ